MHEQETDALRAFLTAREGDRLVSSALVRTELPRVLMRFSERGDVRKQQAQAATQEALAIMRRIDLVRVGAVVLDRAGRQPPARLRSLEAIHLVTSLALGPRLEAMVVYDERLAEAAREAGLAVEAPVASA